MILSIKFMDISVNSKTQCNEVYIINILNITNILLYLYINYTVYCALFLQIFL